MKLLHIRFRTVLALFILGLLGHPAPAQVNVEVGTLVPVGIGPINGPQGNAVVQVVSNDLKRTGMISPTEAGSGDYQASGDASEGQLTGNS